MVQATFPALGGTATVAVTDPARLEHALGAVEETVASFDRTCSRFREDSELSRLNAAAGSTIRVTPLLLEAVQASLRAARLTDGAVDPTVGQALIALGYGRDFDEIDRDAPPRAPTIAPAPGWRAIAVDSRDATIRLPKGVTLDLGATAKALAADHAAAGAAIASDCGVLVGLSGDIAVAGLPPDDGWRIRVTDDHRAGLDAPGQWISIRDGGLATSSTTVRRWASSHHLIDPATGLPAPVVWRTVSVAAASCLDANIASTAAVIQGESALAWLEAQRLPSRLVGADGDVLHVAGWPRDGDDLETRAAA